MKQLAKGYDHHIIQQFWSYLIRNNKTLCVTACLRIILNIQVYI